MFKNRLVLLSFLIVVCSFYAQCNALVDDRRLTSGDQTVVKHEVEGHQRSIHRRTLERNQGFINSVNRVIIDKLEKNVSDMRRDYVQLQANIKGRIKSSILRDDHDQAFRRLVRRETENINRNVLRHYTDTKSEFHINLNRRAQLQSPTIRLRRNIIHGDNAEVSNIRLLRKRNVISDVLNLRNYREFNTPNRDERVRRNVDISERTHKVRQHRIGFEESRRKNLNLKAVNVGGGTVFDTINPFKQTWLLQFEDINYFMILVPSLFIYDLVQEVTRGCKGQKFGGASLSQKIFSKQISQILN